MIAFPIEVKVICPYGSPRFPCLVEVFILRLECSEVPTHCSDLVSFLQSSFSQQPLGGLVRPEM